mmetsp:Transcript_38156/g.103361  ORF Transcript_38156/g.103361 Transcript_38156/m.103361 type:complete len:218 (-) Transcript_38156:4-657(-)
MTKMATAAAVESPVLPAGGVLCSCPSLVGGKTAQIAPPSKMSAGLSQAGCGLVMTQAAALVKQMAPRSLPCTTFFTRPVTAPNTSATPTALHAIATEFAADLGVSTWSLMRWKPKPMPVMRKRPGKRNIRPEVSPPFTPCWVMPMAKATCVLEGPGKQFAMATSSMKRSTGNHLCSSTKRFWNMPKCTGGPPKEVQPRTKKCLAMAPTEGASVSNAS